MTVGSMAPLSDSAVQQMMQAFHRRDPSGYNFKPVLQVIELRKLASKQGGERSKLLISDGVHFVPAMLASQCSNMALASGVGVNTVVQLDQWMMQTVTNNSRGPGAQDLPVICVIMELSVVSQEPSRIGNPVDIKSAAPSATPIQPVAQASGPYGQPAPSGYGQPPASAYGQPPQNAYGQPAYGQGPPQNSYGQPQTGMYGQPPANTGMYGQPAGNVAGAGAPYGAPAPGGAYGAPAPGGAYGAPAPGGAYGAPAPGGAYGAPPQSGTYGGYQASSAAYPGPGAATLPARYTDRGGATARNTAPSQYTPIKDVGPYISRWTIKGRCTAKGDLKKYNKNGNEGCVFNFELSDNTGEVRIVGFKEAAQKFYDVVQQGQCFTLTKATARLMDSGKRKWNQTGHDCEIYLDQNSVLELAPDDQDTAALPRVLLKLSKVAEIENMEAGRMCDVMGVLESCGEWSELVRRDGTPTRKRPFVIRDDSNCTVEVTLWGDKTENPGEQLHKAAMEQQHPVVCIKSARVGDFNGKTLSTVSSSVVLVDPMDVDGVPQLKAWYSQGGAARTPQALSQPGKGGRADRRVTLGMIRDEGLGHGQPTWVQVHATVVQVRVDPMTYPACWGDFGGRKCQKKMHDNDGSGEYSCERCGTKSEPMWRYLLNMTVCDFQGQLENVAIFGEAGEPIVGMPASEAHELEVRAANGEDGLMEELMSRITYRAKLCKIKCHEDTYNDEMRIKYTLASSDDVDFAAESRAYLSMIEDMQAGKAIAKMQRPAAKAGTPKGTQGYGAADTGLQTYGAPAAGGYGVAGYGGGAAHAGGGGGWGQQQPAQGMAFLDGYNRGY